MKPRIAEVLSLACLFSAALAIVGGGILTGGWRAGVVLLAALFLVLLGRGLFLFSNRR
jgi:hypothetical protein